MARAAVFFACSTATPAGRRLMMAEVGPLGSALCFSDFVRLVDTTLLHVRQYLAGSGSRTIPGASGATPTACYSMAPAAQRGLRYLTGNTVSNASPSLRLWRRSQTVSM